MALYKFRVMYEEDETIFRDIEIKPSNTLFDFESTIISAYNLPSNYTGIFFKSNDNWQRLKEMNAGAKPEEKKAKTKAKAQSLPILVTFIDDPHQKFIYEYKGNQEFVFLMELISLSGMEKIDIVYPACVRQQGPSPFKKEDMIAHYGRGASVEKQEEVVDEEEDDMDAMNLEGDSETEEVEAEADTDTDAAADEEEAMDEVEESEEEDEEKEFLEEEDIPQDGFGDQFGEDEDLE